MAAAAAETQRLLAPGGAVGGVGGVALRTQAPLGAPLILSPRMSQGAQAGLLNGSGAQAAAGLLSPGEPAHQLIYASPYDYANYAALTAAAANPLLTTEYAAADHTGGLFARWSLRTMFDNRGLRVIEQLEYFEDGCHSSNNFKIWCS